MKVNSTSESGDYVYCWGNNNFGQLGNGKSIPSLIPGPITFGSGMPLYFRAIKAGLNHTCAIDSKKHLWCWGDNTYGQLGRNPAIIKSSKVPIPVASSLIFAPKSLALGANHTCAIAIGGGISGLYCFGKDDMGQVGNGVESQYVYTPVLISENFTKAFAGNNNTCGIDSKNNTSCWGDNTYGQLGNSHVGGYSVTPQVVIEGQFSSLSTGNHACGISSVTQGVYCWGKNDYGQLGDGKSSSLPTPLPSQVLINNQPMIGIKISTGEDTSCAIVAGNESSSLGTYCWGRNDNGQVGTNQMQSILPSPSFVSGN